MNDGALDAERARLIDSIYEAVLRPEHYDTFMDDWARHIEQAQARLGALRVSAGPERATLVDPVIEAHFRRAFDMLERMGRGPAGTAPTLPDPVGRPVLCLRRRGAIEVPGPEGAALFGLSPDLAAVLAALEPDSAQRLAAMAAALDRAPAAGQFAVLALAGSGGSEGGAGLLAARSQRGPTGEVELVVRHLRLAWTGALESILSQTFGLSPREIDLVRGLSQGSDLVGLARATGRSHHTLRAQVKSVFQKTRTASQADLMRQVAALILYGGTGGAPAAPNAGTDWGEARQIALPGGRQMPVHLIGPPDGRPVVFVHGMLDGIAVTRRIGEELAALGLRLVAPVRANFGAAQPDDRVREAPEVFARDMAEVLGALGIERTLILGHMAGALYAFAAAARLDRRVAGVVNVSGGVPIRSVRQFALMTPRQRTVALTARFAPALLPAILRAGIAQIDGKDASAFMAALYADGTRDRAVVSDPDIAGAIVEGYRFSVAQGEQAFRIDSWHVTRDWSALVTASRCPALLLHGAHDPVVHADTVRAFAEGSNRITCEVAADEGQLQLYSAPRRILARIAAFGDQVLA